MSRMKKMFLKELLKNDLVYTVNCTDDENAKFKDMKKEDMPDDVDKIDESVSLYFKYSKGDLTDEQMKLYLLAKQNSHLKAIRYCLIFFVVLAIIGIIVGCVLGYQIYNAIHSISSIGSTLPTY